MSRPIAPREEATWDGPLVFWLPSACRSVAPLCEAVARQHPAGVTVVLQQLQTANRAAMHWKSFPFRECNVRQLPDTADRHHVSEVLSAHAHAFHIFASYHSPSPILTAAIEAGRRRIPYGVLSEAPLPMRTGVSRLLHRLYLATALPLRVRPVVRSARFLLCESGCDFRGLARLGWGAEQLFPFGYFPEAPPYRASARTEPFLRILSVGGLTRHKGNHVLLDACKVLSRRKIPFMCEIVGDGPERQPLARMVRRHGLDDVVRFHGFIDDAALAGIASQSSVLACPGLEEPWGIRVNDALHAALIPIVSRGVGASQIVARFGAGLIFPAGDGIALAECFSMLHHTPAVVEELRSRIELAARCISPTVAAAYLRSVVRSCTSTVAERPSPAWL